ncbi:hypothetical protein [Methylomonas fluvii]|nr:hypothetical protein [Methylomonas fluvii]
MSVAGLKLVKSAKLGFLLLMLAKALRRLPLVLDKSLVALLLV